MNARTNHPSRTGFRIQFGEGEDEVPVLQLTGDLDADGAPILSAELERQLRSGEKLIRLDFDGVDFISSAGVGSLIAGVGEFRDEGGDLQVLGMSEDHRRVLEVLGLLEYVNL